MDPDSADRGKCPLRILVAVFAYNEGEKLLKTVSAFPSQPGYDILLVDDGSTDGSSDSVRDHDLEVIRSPQNEGLGASIKKSFRYAIDQQYDILVIMAGNGKDQPPEIERLLQPLLHDECDFVQGSRFLKGGAYGNMPLSRVVATRYIHPLLFSLLSGRRVTESTNGFRAFRTSILRDERIQWEQCWLDQYELEQYLHFKVVRLAYRRKEVPVSKLYPPKGDAYTKVRPFTGWWSMIKPLVYLVFGIKH